MKRHLRIVIEAGEHTCRATPEGPWCPMLRYKSWRGTAHCDAFNKSLPEVNCDGSQADDIAWVGRLPECKAAEVAS